MKKQIFLCIYLISTYMVAQNGRYQRKITYVGQSSQDDNGVSTNEQGQIVTDTDTQSSSQSSSSGGGGVPATPPGANRGVVETIQSKPTVNPPPQRPPAQPIITPVG